MHGSGLGLAGIGDVGTREGCLPSGSIEKRRKKHSETDDSKGLHFVGQICWGSQTPPSDTPAGPWILMRFQIFKSTSKSIGNPGLV